jgi:four helix bundle protein
LNSKTKGGRQSQIFKTTSFVDFHSMLKVERWKLRVHDFNWRPTLNIQLSTLNQERKTMTKQTYDLEERLLEYSVRIIKLVEQLPNSRTGNHVAGQLLRSGTSPFPNHGEAQAAESSKDFVHKLRIALKELRESKRWLRLIQKVPLIDDPKLIENLLNETEELIKIFATSIKTAERKKI